MGKQELHRVTKLGNSLAVVLPVDVCRSLGINRGDFISFGVFEENTVVLRKLTPENLKALKPKQILYGE